MKNDNGVRTHFKGIFIDREDLIRNKLKEEQKVKNKIEFKRLLVGVNNLLFAPLLAAVFGLGSFFIFSLANNINNVSIFVIIFFSCYMSALMNGNLFHSEIKEEKNENNK
jgi:hypothetical protein